MKVMLSAFVVAVVLASVAAVALTTAQKNAYQAYVTSGARVTHPGENLVGSNWNGDPKLSEGRRS